MSLYGRGVNNEYLSPDMCYAAWLISGSIAKAQKRLFDAGITNPESGRAPSRMGIWFSANRSPLFEEFTRVREQSPTQVSGMPSKEEFEEGVKIFNTCVSDYHAKFG